MNELKTQLIPEIKKYKIIDNFVHLHIHSTYSFQDGYGLPKQYYDIAEKLGQTAIAITDHGNISGHYKWYKEGLKRGIKPILGCEMYVVDSLKKENGYYHMTIIVLNNQGYKNLIKLVTKSWLEGFYYKPRIEFKDLVENKEGLLITSGCGNLFKDLSEKQSRNKLIEMKEAFGENFYVEVIPHSFEKGIINERKIYNLAKELKLSMVATMDCHYPEANQNKIQEILLCIQSNDTMENPNRWKFDQEDLYLKSRKEMEESFKKYYPDLDFTEALDNTIKIANMVDFEFPKAEPIKFPMADKEKIDYFRKICTEGLIKKGLNKKQNYIDRLNYEMELIIKKDFVDYFLIISDLCIWAKNNNILVGPARGSAAGSLTCWVVGITEVDPIKHELLFERFIDINRYDTPDIDIDFEDEKRILVKQYLANKYSQDKVGSIATFSTFKGKMCLQDIGRIYKIPFAAIDKLKSLLIERSGGDSRASFTVMDTFKEFESAKQIINQYPQLEKAAQLEAQIRQISIHAAGIVISNEPLTNFCAIYQRQGEQFISMDYADVSDIGLLKIDILGLNTLTSLHKAKDLVKQNYPKMAEINYYDLSLKDTEVYKGFQNNEKLFGIFQFDGQAVNQVCRQIKPNNFEELSDINALARPGPLNSGSTTLYINRKNGFEKIEYQHPLMEKITKDTFGIVIYQEQVMRVMREIGLMSWKDTADIRKNISRSRGLEAFNEFKDKFDEGALSQNIPQKTIDNIWNSVCTFGSWAFNKSHSVSYTYISYWTMYMKIHFPLEYYAAILSTVHQEDKIKKIIKEYRREGHQLYQIDVNKSKSKFMIDGQGIRIGFSDIKGVGEKTADIIEQNQPYHNYQEFLTKLKGKRITSKVINAIETLGGFNSIGGIIEEEPNLFNPKLKIKQWNPPTFDEMIKYCPIAIEFNIKKEWQSFIDKYLIRQPINISDLVKESTEADYNKEYQYGSMWKQEKFIMGIVYDKNLRDKLEISTSKGRKVNVAEGEPTAFCNFMLEDDDDFITIRVGTKTFPKYKKLIFEDLKENDVIYIRGAMGSGIRMFFANSIVCLRIIKEKIEKSIPLTEDEKLMVKPNIKEFVNI